MVFLVLFRGGFNVSRVAGNPSPSWNRPARAATSKPIHERSKARNKRLASPRARVEHVFASLTQMGGKVVRSIGLARAEFSLVVKSAVYNLKRMSSLLEMA